MSRSVLVLLAHTDDETLGCGGTISRLARDGWDVQTVLLTDGVVTVRPGEPQDNRNDCVEACATLGVAPPTLLGFADQFLDQIPVAELVNAVNDLGLLPDLIISHSDADLNQDHRIAGEVARIVGRPKDRPVALLACEVPSSSFWNGVVFAGNYFVDITDTLEQKLSAFACYQNEVQPASSPRSLEGIELLARYHGMQTGVAAAEAFQVIRGASGMMP